MLEPVSTTSSSSPPVARLRVPIYLWGIFALVGAITLAPVWNAPGWPMNHETWAFAQRTHIYARHLAEFDLFPLWTSADNAGFGSPQPLFYHRLFYLLAGPLALLSGSNKIGDGLAVLVALVIGAAGTYRLTRELGGGLLASTVAGISLIAANYTVTNWLVRGAVAEMIGAMLIPWVLAGLVRSCRDGIIHLELGLTLGLLWHAHSVMAFYMGLLLASTSMMLIAIGAVPMRLLDPRTAWRALAVFALLVGPHLALMAMFRAPYDLSRFLSGPFVPTSQFLEPRLYLWDTHWIAGHTSAGLPVQLDLPILAVLALALAAGALRGVLKATTMAATAPVMIPLVLCLTLQLPWSAVFYDHVPGALYLQFPWRLLGVITPALIAVSLALADTMLPIDKRLLAFGVCTGWMVAGSLALVPLADGRVPVDPASMTTVAFSGFREYEPVHAPPLKDLTATITNRWTEVDCEVSRENADEEVLVVLFHATCQRATTLPLPVYASRLHRVRVSGFDRPMACVRTPDLPDVCSATVPAGSHLIEVELPTLDAVLRSLSPR